MLLIYQWRSTMEKFLNIFRSLDRSWLIRHYIFSFAFFGLLFVMLKGFSTPLPVWLLYLSFTLFYPFAMFVYESIVDLIIGDNIFSHSCSYHDHLENHSLLYHLAFFHTYRLDRTNLSLLFCQS